MIYFFIALLIVILDQAVKYVINTRVGMEMLKPVIDKFFYISHYENTGVAWSLFNNKIHIILPITIIVAIGVTYYMYKADTMFLKICLSLILGGAVGNIIDRLRKGSVTDFLEFHFGSYVFPVFNVADTFVVIGTIMLGIYIVFFYKEIES